MGRMGASALVLAVALVFSGPSVSAEKSLYERAGGYDAIAALTDDFLGQLMADKEFSVFFVGMSTDTEHRVRQEIVEFFCNAMGGPCYYTGRDMKLAHAGLGITGDQWQRSLGFFVGSMNKLKVPPDVQKDIAAAVGPLQTAIVDKP